MIILDPSQDTAILALKQISKSSNKCQRIFGRINIENLLNASTAGVISQDILMPLLDTIYTTFSRYFLDHEGENNGFNGILLAGCNLLPTPVFHELTSFFSDMGLEVYVEAQGPQYLADPSVLVSESISGLLVRNSLVKANGERQDYFDMESFRLTVKAFMSQACIRDFSVLAWEALDDGVLLSNAILKRTFDWCNFHSVIPFIGPSATSLDKAIDNACIEPLSAFEWLKQPQVIELQLMWNSYKTVSTLIGHYYNISEVVYNMLCS